MHQKRLSETAELVKELVASLVDHPEDVQVAETSGLQATVLEIIVRKSDQGKVIGRRGRLIDALRQLLKCRGGREGRTYRIALLEGPADHISASDPGTRPARMADPVPATTELLLRLIRTLVDAPDSVRVIPLDGVRSVVFEVALERGDVGKVLGRGGSTASALRELLLSLGTRTNRNYLLEVLEP